MQNRFPVLVACSAAACAALLLWDSSALDLKLALLVGNAHGFPLRDAPLLTTVAHTGAKWLAWLLVLLLSLSVTWPVGALRRLPMNRRVQLAATAFIASGLISALKAFSHTSCPWDLHEFGGVAIHVSHWLSWAQADGGSGRCFPAGHAATGFAFVGGYFAWRHESATIARRWLLAAMVAGLVLGVAQQLRGAHFMSHTLWTGWLCWIVCWLTDPLFARARRRPIQASETEAAAASGKDAATGALT
jgi:membrane-associated PAP2 superfamily phosphatase